MDRSKRFGWDKGELVPISKPRKRYRPYISMSTKELTVEDLRVIWNTPGAKRLWGARARDAVDKTFKAAAKEHKVTHWNPIRFDRYYLRHVDAGEPLLRTRLLEDLESSFWCQDAGWETMDDALEGISRMTRRPLAKEATMDQIGEWTDAWNRLQREYAIGMYGVDINFGNIGYLFGKRRWLK